LVEYRQGESDAVLIHHWLCALKNVPVFKGLPYGVEQVNAIFEYRSTKYAIETAVVGEGVGVQEVEDDGCCC
jgi:hypothetical protein